MIQLLIDRPSGQTVKILKMILLSTASKQYRLCTTSRLKLKFWREL